MDAIRLSADEAQYNIDHLEAEVERLEREMDAERQKIQPKPASRGYSNRFDNEPAESDLERNLRITKDKLARAKHQSYIESLMSTFLKVEPGKVVYAVFETGYELYCGSSKEFAEREIGWVKGQGKVVDWTIEDKEE